MDRVAASKVLIAVALVCFVIAAILTVVLANGIQDPHFWGFTGLAAWALAALL